MMNWEAIFWLVAMVVFLGTEAATVSLVSIWFAVGALAAVFTALLGGSLKVQVILFLLVSSLLLIFLRSLVRRYLTPHTTRTNAEGVVGQVGVVIVPVNNIAALGQVTISGLEWSARSTTGAPLMEGAKVRVDRIEGVKVFVSPVEESTADNQ